MRLVRMIRTKQKPWRSLGRGVVVVTLVLGIVGLSSLNAFGSEEWSLEKAAEQYSGTHIHVLVEALPTFQKLIELVPEFEEKTGIRVTISTYPWQELHRKIAMELFAKTGVYDAVNIDCFWAAEFTPYLLDIEALLKEHPELEDPNYNWDGIPQKLQDSAARYWKGKYALMSTYTYIRMMNYRKDLFENPQEKEKFRERYGYELKPPNTETAWNEFKDYAEFFTRDTDGDGKIDLWGYLTYIAKDLAILQEYAAWMYGAGGTFFEDWQHDKWKPTINSEANLRALRYFVSLMDYVPEAALNWWNASAVLAIQKGAGAMFPLGAGKAYDLEDPEKSEVAGKVGYSTVPQSAGQIGPMPLGITSTKNPEATFLFSQWATSEDTVRRSGATPPVRVSLLSDPELVKAQPWFPAVREILERGYLPPIFPEFTQWEQILELQLHLAAQKEITPKQALDTAQEETIKLLKEAGYKW